MRECILDFETISAVDLRLVGADRYAQDPTTAILSLTYTLLGSNKRLWTPGINDPYLGALSSDESVIFIAHNASFEKAIWRHKMVPEFGFAPIVNERWADTMAVSAMKQMPQDLDTLLHVLNSPFEKDTEGSSLTKSLSRLNKKGYYPARDDKTMRRVYDYNTSDIEGEVWLHKRIGSLPASERRVWILDQCINERGVRLDLDFVKACMAVVEGATKPLAREFSSITNGLSFTQRDRILDWVGRQGVSLPNLKKETLTQILGETEDGEGIDDPFADINEPVELPANVRRALEIRQQCGSSNIKKLSRMLACVSFDGRARGLLQYHGAGPGRWAGRLFQPQNFARPTLKVGDDPASPEQLVDAIMTGDHEYVAATFGDPIEAVISSLRHTIVPEEGHLLNVGDFSTIEARIVLALSGQHDKTAIMAAGKDIYVDMAEAIYECKVDKKKDPEKRQTGKNSVLGLGFQMGWRKFQARYAKDMDDEFCQGVVNTYRQEWAPLVPKVWSALENAALTAIYDKKPAEAFGVEYRLEDGWLSARLPSGRKLWYFNPLPIKKAMPWDETDIRLAWTYKAMKLGQWRTLDAYGGLLTENVVQGLARDLLVDAMFKCEKNGLPVVLTVHDEIISEPEDFLADPLALREIMCDTPSWAKALQIPVAAECWAGNRYRK